MIDSDKVTVAALIRRPKDGAIFLQKRRPDCGVLAGAWDVVGGKVEIGESELQAIEREVLEETGWKASRVLCQLGADNYVLQGDAWTDKSYLVEVDDHNKEPCLERHKYACARWFSTVEDLYSTLQVNQTLGFGNHIARMATRALSESKRRCHVRP